MNYRYIAVIIVNAVLAAAVGARAGDASEKLPFSEKIIRGKMDNGIQYYVMENSFPPGMVELRLNVRTGSLNERDDERGIAHFVEHMAFNGTRNFKGNDLIKFMESLGMTFGRHSNAYTSTNNTNYQLSVPSGRGELLDSSFMFMRDWVDGISFDPLEIEKEKGVIVEEWRARNDVRSRAAKKNRELILEGSLYPERDPIGDMDIVKGANRELLKGYYDRLYTADHVSVIAVGDIKAEKIIQLIKKHFSDVPAKRAPAGPDPNIRIKNGLRMRTFSDPELTSHSLSYSLFHPSAKTETYADLKEMYLRQGALRMLNRRMQNKIREKGLQLLSFRAAGSEVVDGLFLLRFAIPLKPETMRADISAMLKEIERARRHGFTEAEYLDMTVSMKKTLERLAEPDHKFESSRYADIICDYDTSGGSLTDFAQDKELFERITSETGPEDCNSAFRALLSSESGLVTISSPESEAEGIKISESEFASMKKAAASSEIKAPVVVTARAALFDEKPRPGKIKQRSMNGAGELIEYENGLSILVKNSKAETNSFVMKGIKPGGYSALGDEEAVLAQLMLSGVAASGFEGVSRSQLDSMMAGVSVRVAPSIGELSFDFDAAGDSRDIEYAFKLINRYMAASSMEENVIGSIKKRMKHAIEVRSADKKYSFFRGAERSTYNGNYRDLNPEVSDLENADIENLHRIYRRHYSEAGSFRFVISGDVSADTAAELGRVYLAGLPSGEDEAAFKDRGVRLRKKFLREEGYGDTERKTSVVIRLEREIDTSDDGEYYAEMIKRVLNKRVREEVREKLGAVYSAGVSLRYSDIPRPSFSGTLSFSCEPSRKDEIISAIMKIISDVAEKGVTEKELDDARKQYLLSLDTASERNMFWSKTLSNDILEGSQPGTLKQMREAVNSITVNGIKRHARMFLDGMSCAVLVYNPEM